MTSGPERSRQAAREAADDPRRYGARLDPVYADHLCGMDEPAGIGRGRRHGEVVLTAAAVAYLQQLPVGWDCHVDAGRRRIYFEGAAHPLTQL
jgi:hypothetical protein